MFTIDGHLIGGSQVFVIAEIGNNHQGSAAMARQLIDVAIEAGADCVKFQLRNREALYRSRDDGSVAEDLGAEYIQDLLNKVKILWERWDSVRCRCS
jgi:N-acetylneuraminate synthase